MQANRTICRQLTSLVDPDGRVRCCNDRAGPFMRNDTEERIRERAYHLWRESGGIAGDADRHWLAAEREVLAAFAAAAPTTPLGPRNPTAEKEKPQSKAKSRSAGGTRRRAS
jgi:hypothetical protein